MRLTLPIYLAIALALSLLANGVLGWKLAGAKPRCEASKAVATVKADQAVRAEETKRDTKLDKVTVETKADTGKAVAKVKEQTHARAEAIDRVAVSGACRAPAGLPALDAAVDQANAAAGD
jgi:hypothetical protein